MGGNDGWNVGGTLPMMETLDTAQGPGGQSLWVLVEWQQGRGPWGPDNRGCTALRDDWGQCLMSADRADIPTSTWYSSNVSLSRLPVPGAVWPIVTPPPELPRAVTRVAPGQELSPGTMGQRWPQPGSDNLETLTLDWSDKRGADWLTTAVVLTTGSSWGPAPGTLWPAPCWEIQR